MYCNRPYEIFAMSSPNYITKRKYSVTLDFDVYEDFNPYEINWNKLFQIEGQEHLDVNIKNLDVLSYKGINVYDIVKKENLIIIDDSLKYVEERLS